MCGGEVQTVWKESIDTMRGMYKTGNKRWMNRQLEKNAQTKNKRGMPLIIPQERI